MRFTPTIFTQIVEPLDRRRFEAMVERRRADAYDKSFGSWDHLMVLIHAQLTVAACLRALETSWNAHANAHYHLGCGEIARSTLADANARRPVQAFAEVLTMVAALTTLDPGGRQDVVAPDRLDPHHLGECSTGPSPTAASAA